VEENQARSEVAPEEVAKAEKKEADKERMANARAARRRKPAVGKQAPNPKAPVILSEGSNIGCVAPVSAAKADSKVVWFSEVDINQHGNVSSDFPAWYFDQHIRELQEDIARIERNVDLDLYRGQHLLKARKEIEMKKGRLTAIQESKPKLEGARKDKVASIAKELGIQIGRAMFTREEKQRGLVDAHVEADRWMNPCIEVKSDVEADYYKRKGVKIVGGKVSRIQAEICWKTMVKALGEEPIANTERLRAMR